MPPFFNALPRSIQPEGKAALEVAGHGQPLNIVDISFARGTKLKNVYYYLGNEDGELTVARALLDIALGCPLEGPFFYMEKDEGDESDRVAPTRNREAIESLGLEAIGLVKDGDGGFYEQARRIAPRFEPEFFEPITFVVANEDSYDCISGKIGHSQSLIH